MVGFFLMEFIKKSLKVNLVLNLCGWKKSMVTLIGRHGLQQIVQLEHGE
jgi:hypothetical protein